MHKIGLVDFWCYENETFTFENGHMLLRGSNGSGKSVTMQSIIPLLLDGNRASERLDPFGTRSRRMDTYLIDENSDRDERIGYLYLEFKREDSDIYKTIGMGIRARKNKPLQTWYFVIEDGRRIGIDIRLMDNGLTLSERQLKNVLGEKQVISSQREYMRKVNDALFGFESIEDYSDAIDLLLQLRSPKLSNSLSPAKINEILRTSLQPLSDEDLRPMSEAIASMDNLQDQLDSLKQSQAAAKKLADVYNQYNQAILIDKWQKMQREQQAYRQIEQNITSLKKAKADYLVQKEQWENERKANRLDKEVKENEYKSLQNSDVQKWLHDLERLEKQIANMRVELDKKIQSYDKKEDIVQTAKNKIAEYDSKMTKFERTCRGAFEEMSYLNESLALSEHIALEVCLKEQQHNFDFNYTRQVLKQALSKIDEALKAWQNYDRQLERVEFYQTQCDELMMTIETLQKEIEDAIALYTQRVEYYLEFIYQYQETNQLFKLKEEEILKLRELLVVYETTKDYSSIQNVVFKSYQTYLNKYHEERIVLEHHKDLVSKQLEDLYNEKRYWDNMVDPEPERTLETKQNRAYLKEHEIPFVPFYQLLNFADELTEQEKGAIEELLSHLHLLDALVIPKQYQGVTLQAPIGSQDFYLWTDLPIDEITSVELTTLQHAQDLFDVFEKMAIEVNDGLCLDTKYFKNGITEGILALNQEATYIGFERRLKLKQAKIDAITQEINIKEAELSNIENSISEYDKKESVLTREYQDFISDKGLKEAYEKVENAQNRHLQASRTYQNLKKQHQQELQSLDKIKNDISSYAKDLMLPMQKEAFEQRKQDYLDYQTEFEIFKDSYIEMLHYQDSLTSEKQKLEELIEDLDELRYEKEKYQDQLTIDTQSKASLQQQLDNAGYSDLASRISQLDQLLQQLDEKHTQLISSISKTEEKITNIDSILLQKENEKEQQLATYNKYFDLFNQEVNEHLIFNDELSEKQLYESMRQLARQWTSKKSVADFQNQLVSVYYEQNAYLVSYHVIQEKRPLCHEVDDLSARIILLSTHLGKKIPLMTLLDILNKNIEEQMLLIQQEDRHIFEEILVNTIGKKIRDRIHASKRWVDKIKRYMSDMNISSGLQLSIDWKGRKASDDLEMDTRHLAELLEKDAMILKDSDRESISNHFRSKIEKARRDSLDENSTASFHQLMKEIMDYRQWYDFTLYAKKPRENKKELTSNVFHAYSGGEKAISMYVPLFSAVAAKFESAREDAPLLVALDEAFAGVDENNIDNMFALITKFRFDYIMNSQVLWGDYPSCPNLAIYELFRPNDAPYVSVVGYTWNGKEKRVKL